MTSNERAFAEPPQPGFAPASDEESQPPGSEIAFTAMGAGSDVVLEDGADNDPAFAPEGAAQAGELGWDGGPEYGSDDTAVRRPDRHGRAGRPRFVAEFEPDESAEVVVRQAEATAVELRLAHLHLRTGSYDLARIQLETLVGAGRLDERGLGDLAESRWRSGDLTGAADAVDAYLAAGGDAPIAFVIAAEARFAEGRPSDARRFARDALERLVLPLDVVFAGQPRSPVWPHDAAQPQPTTGTLFAPAAASAVQGGRIGVAERPRGEHLAGGLDADESQDRARMQPTSGFWDEPSPIIAASLVAAAAARSAADEAPVVPLVDLAPGQIPMPVTESALARVTTLASDGSAAVLLESTDGSATSAPAIGAAPLGQASSSPTPDAQAELQRARDALADSELHTAAVRLAVVLRLSPALAPLVLDLVAELPGSEFDLLRGDALRLVGHESAAHLAYAAAMDGLGADAREVGPSAVPPDGDR